MERIAEQMMARLIARTTGNSPGGRPSENDESQNKCLAKSDEGRPKSDGGLFIKNRVQDKDRPGTNESRN
jgi:hypothetical protein